MPTPQLPFTLPFSDFIEDPLHDLTVQQDASDRLLQQYKRPNLQALVQALAAPAQDLEDALIQLYLNRWLPTALGAQLDLLGRIVGQPRGGFSDDFYRLILTARILINRSSGAIEELYTIFSLIVPSYVTQALVEFKPAAFNLTLSGAISSTLGPFLGNILHESRAGGVGGQLIWSLNPPSATFTLDGSSTQALDNGHLAEASA